MPQYLNIQIDTCVLQGGAPPSGHIIFRVVEVDGSVREFTRPLESRIKTHQVSLRARPRPTMAFDELTNDEGGYSPLELMRMLQAEGSRTPTSLAYITVKSGVTAVYQPTPCLAEMLYCEPNLPEQVDAIRALAERPRREDDLSNPYNINVYTLPCLVLIGCLRGEAGGAGIGHCPVVRGEAALAVGQWMINHAPSTCETVGHEVWIGVEGLKQYWSERVFEGGCVGVVRAMLRAKKRKTPGDDKWEYLEDVDGDIEWSGVELKWVDDEESLVRGKVLTAMSCIRAKDGLTPQAALDFLIEVFSHFDHFDRGIVSVDPERIPKEKIEEGLSRAAEVDLSKSVAEAFLSLCHVNVRMDSNIHSEHPCFPLMKATHSRLERELFENGGGKIAASCIAALCHLGMLRMLTGVAPPNDGDTIRKSDLATSMKFYSSLFDEFDDLDVRGASAQAYACLACAIDAKRDPREKSRLPGDPIGMLHAMEFLLDCTLKCDNSELKVLLMELMLDCCTGRIATTQRAAINSCYGTGSVEALNRIVNGPLGRTFGEENASGALGLVKDRNFPTANSVNNGCRAGMGLLKRAGSEDTWTKKKFEVPTVMRVAKFATRLWNSMHSHEVRLDEDLRISFVNVWTLLWPTRLNKSQLDVGCPALYRARKVLAAGGSAANEVQKFFRHDPSTELRIASEEDMSKVNEAKKIMGEIKAIMMRETLTREVRDSAAQRHYEAEMERFNRGGGLDTRGGDSQRPMELVQRDGLWKEGSWVASVAQQRKRAESERKGGQVYT